jgi:hypothetical protein
MLKYLPNAELGMPKDLCKSRSSSRCPVSLEKVHMATPYIASSDLALGDNQIFRQRIVPLPNWVLTAGNGARANRILALTSLFHVSMPPTQHVYIELGLADRNLGRISVGLDCFLDPS